MWQRGERRRNGSETRQAGLPTTRPPPFLGYRAMTDVLDFPVWEQLGEAQGRRLFDLLAELAMSLPPDDQLDWEQIYEN